jgi:tetratricopeptide (TPR) repeat protein
VVKRNSFQGRRKPALFYPPKCRYLEAVNPFSHRAFPAFLVLLSLSVASFAQQLQVNPAPLAITAELQKRVETAAYAQRTGTPEDVAKASKAVIALGLAEFADLRSIQGAVPASISLYRQGLTYEDSPRMHFWLALTYNTAGHVDEALQETAAILAVDPKDASAWNLQGKLLMQKQKYLEAAASFDKSLGLRMDMEAAYTMASALLLAKETDKAAVVFRQMGEMSNGTASVRIMAARAYEAAGLNADAEREYKTAATAPDAARVHAHYFLGLFYLTHNQWESTPQIVEEFQREVELNPSDFFGNYFLGYLASAAKNYDESDKYLKVAAAARPDWPEPPLYMGLNAYGRGDDKQAETLLRSAIKLTGNDEARNDYQIRRAYFTLGRILIRKGLKDEGTRDVERSKEMETHLVVKARQQQALDSRHTGGVAQLSTDSSTAPKPISLDVVGDPSAPVSPAVLAKADLEPELIKRLESTEKQLRFVLGRAFNDLGTSLARQREFAPALKEFQSAEHWNPNTENLMRNIGMAAYRAGNFTESARALKLAVGANPEDQRAQGLLAMSLSLNGDYAGAASTFDRLGDLTLADPDMAFHWAQSLVKTNQPAQAKMVLVKMSRLSIPYEVLVKSCKLYGDMGDTFNAQACDAKAKSLAPTPQAH